MKKLTKKLKSNIVLIILLIVTCFLFLSVVRNDHSWGDDFMSYIMQARSIVEGSMPSFLNSNQLTINSSSLLVSDSAVFHIFCSNRSRSKSN